MFDKLYHRASFSPIAHFALELEHFVCDHATIIEDEKLQSKVLLYTHIAFPYTTHVPEVN